jgi:uncharacterized damage-inducible protein DinB
MMNNHTALLQRRKFLKTSSAASAALTGLFLFPQAGLARPSNPEDPLTIIGPKEGYSPQIGTLVSMMAFCRSRVVRSVKNMTTEQLDFLLDAKANTIGALLYHLAALDASFHEATFKGTEWGKWDDKFTQKYDVARNLGEPARKTIKGNDLDFYLNLLQETRESTLVEFRKRDDQWLMALDKTWVWGPTNTYCKWFHVCEHESHHQGQIALIKSRIPGIKAAE